MSATADGVADAVLAVEPRLGGVRVLAVDGPSGSGKSTFAARVVDELRKLGVTVALVSTDDFATWERPASWWPRLVGGVLAPLAGDEPGGYRRMVWVGGVAEEGPRVDVAVPDVLVLEGVSAGRASIRPRLSHLCWVCDPDPRTRLDRAVARDGESSRPFLEAWQRFEHGWYAADRTRVYADSSIGPAGEAQAAQ